MAYDLVYHPWFVEALGGLAFLLCVMRYVYNHMLTILRMHSSSNILFGLQMLLLGNITGAIMCLLASLRSFLFSTATGQSHKKYIVLAMVPSALSLGFYHSETIFDVAIVLTILPLIYAEFKSCEKQYRAISVITAVPWIAYGLYAETYGMFLASSLAFTSCVTAILRYDYPHLLPQRVMNRRGKYS